MTSSCDPSTELRCKGCEADAVRDPSCRCAIPLPQIGPWASTGALRIGACYHCRRLRRVCSLSNTAIAGRPGSHAINDGRLILVPKRETSAGPDNATTADESASSNGDYDAAADIMQSRSPTDDQSENVNHSQEQAEIRLESERGTGDADRSALAGFSWTAETPHVDVPTSPFRVSRNDGISQDGEREYAILWAASTTELQWHLTPLGSIRLRSTEIESGCSDQDVRDHFIEAEADANATSASEDVARETSPKVQAVPEHASPRGELYQPWSCGESPGPIRSDLSLAQPDVGQSAGSGLVSVRSEEAQSSTRAPTEDDFETLPVGLRATEYPSNPSSVSVFAKRRGSHH